MLGYHRGYFDGTLPHCINDTPVRVAAVYLQSNLKGTSACSRLSGTLSYYTYVAGGIWMCVLLFWAMFRKANLYHRTPNMVGNSQQDRPSTIMSLHDAVCTYAHTTLLHLLVSFSIAWCGEKQQNLLELLIYFMEGFKISTVCVCWL